MSGFEFSELLYIVAFLAIVWFSEKISEWVGLSALVGAIFGGILCGPNGIDIVPWWCDHKDDTCEGVTPFVMVGQIGVTFMIAESGTHFNFQKVKKVAGKGLLVAMLGTFIPLISGMLLIWGLGFDLYPDGFAAGASLAPTSVGIAITLLTEHKQLNSIAGQTIVTAAFIDDVFCLVIFVVLGRLAEGSLGVWTMVEPFLFSFIFLGVGTWLSVNVWPTFIHNILGRIVEKNHLSHQPRDMVHLGLILGFMVFMCAIGAFIGSHLLGAFVAGMSFSEVPRSHYVWRRQMKRISDWCVRMFFAATVGFSIPVNEMFQLDSFWKGCVLAVTSAIIGKVVAGLHTGEYRWVIGFAMVARGEFAYLVAETSTSICYTGSSHDTRRSLPAGECTQYMMSSSCFAVVVWALLIATIVAPNAFEWFLKKAFLGKPRSGIEMFVIKAEGPHHTGMHFEIADVLHGLHLDVMEAKTESDGKTVFGTWLVQTTDLADELDKDKIDEIEHMIKEAVNCEDTQISISATFIGLHKAEFSNSPKSIPIIQFDWERSKSAAATNREAINARELPAIYELNNKTEVWLEIRIMTMHDKTIVTEVLETLDDLGLHIMKGHTEVHHGHEEEVYFAKCSRLGSVTRNQTRKALKALFHKHQMKAQIMVKKVSASDAIESNERSHISVGTLNVITMQTNSVLDDLEEGYEITLEVAHAERDPHLVSHISRTMTDQNLDVAFFNTDEADLSSQAYIKMTFFVRSEAPNKDARTPKIIKSTINQYVKEYNLETKAFRITPIFIEQAKDLTKTIGKNDTIELINEKVKVESFAYTKNCLKDSIRLTTNDPFGDSRLDNSVIDECRTLPVEMVF